MNWVEFVSSSLCINACNNMAWREFRLFSCQNGFLSFYGCKFAPIMSIMRKLLFVTLAIAGLAACRSSHIKEDKDLGEVFKAHQITDGCFEIYDNSHDIVHYFNKERCATGYTPASTFKVMNSLVALQTGVALDESLVIPWDGVTRSMPEWNKDMDMREAFKVSCVPYYQELARRIGKKDMQHYLDTVQYGNKKIGGAIDQFWLDGSLRITADEQVGFMKKLYHDELPFSKRNQRIVRSMMMRENEEKYKLSYKTGVGSQNDTTIAWIVGFAEDSMSHPYFFAMNFSTVDTTMDVPAKRLDLLHDLLKQKGIIPTVK